jgi:hypothetical protein
MKLKFEKRGAEGIEPSRISPIHGSTLRATPIKATFALTQTPLGVFRPIRTRQCAWEWILHIHQVLQGHLLKAVEVLPSGGSADRFEGKVRIEEFSDKLRTGRCKCIHGKRV